MNFKENTNSPLIGVVGVCASGKSTLIEGLTIHGYRARHIAQEHSYVKDMWRRITNPDVLIFLDVTYAISRQRRDMDWSIADYEEQQIRLSNARQNADLYVDTSTASVEDVLDLVLDYLNKNIRNSA